MIFEFSQTVFSLIVLGSIAGVGFTLLFLVFVLIKEIQSKQLW